MALLAIDDSVTLWLVWVEDFSDDLRREFEEELNAGLVEDFLSDRSKQPSAVTAADGGCKKTQWQQSLFIYYRTGPA